MFLNCSQCARISRSDSIADNHALQVPCHRYDPDALLKSWYFKYIAIGISLVAYGSTKDKVLHRALGGDDAEGDPCKSFPLEGSIAIAVEDVKQAASFHAANPQTFSRPGHHVMVVSSPGESSEQIFAFETQSARDAFMNTLQVIVFLPLCFILWGQPRLT